MMKISAQFATSLDSPEHIVAAEQLGYDRAWLFDTPHESPDVWMMLALAAERTTRIGLGPGVLVPSLRHPMVNASATAALEALAPGRVAVAFGTGFAGAREVGRVAIRLAPRLGHVHAEAGRRVRDRRAWLRASEGKNGQSNAQICAHLITRLYAYLPKRLAIHM